MRILLMLAASFLVVNHACAEDAILSRGYFEDKSNALSIAQIEQQQFTPYERMLAKGFSTGTYWLKLKIRSGEQDLVLRTRPFFTEEIELFDPESTQDRPKIGAKYPSSASDIEALSYNYTLPTGVSDRAIYLRVKSARSYMINVEVMSLGEFRKADRKDQLICSSYAAFTLILALWLLATWLINKELVLGVFTLQQFMAFFHAIFYTGLAKEFIDDSIGPLVLNSSFSIIVVTYPLIAFLANKLLLEEYGIKMAYKWLFNAFLGLSLVVVALYLSGSTLAFKLNNITILIAMLFFMVAALFGLNLSRASVKASALPVKALRLFYTFNAIIWVVALLPILGVINAGEISMYSMLVYNIASGTVFFFMLQYRAKSLLLSETERASALKVEAEQERKQREEQSMLMAMLSHEIKTPLSVLKLVMDEKVAGSDLEGHANRAVSNINAIVNRCLQLGKLDTKAIELNPEWLNADEFTDALLQDYQAGARVDARVSQDLLIYADREVLRVIVANLLENALKYAPAKSIIRIDMKYFRKGDSDGVAITVLNAMGPMGAPDAEQVFKKYYRNSQATKISGSGLGLFLVNELINVMGGNATYKANQEKVIFSLWIPT